MRPLRRCVRGYAFGSAIFALPAVVGLGYSLLVGPLGPNVSGFLFMALAVGCAFSALVLVTTWLGARRARATPDEATYESPQRLRRLGVGFAVVLTAMVLATMVFRQGEHPGESASLSAISGLFAGFGLAFYMGYLWLRRWEARRGVTLWVEPRFRMGSKATLWGLHGRLLYTPAQPADAG